MNDNELFNSVSHDGYSQGEVHPNLNPFTATACKISGLKNAHIHATRQYIWWSYNKSAVNTVPFDSALAKGAKKPWWFQIWHFYWLFSSDIMAVKGLNGFTELPFVGWCRLDTERWWRATWVVSLWTEPQWMPAECGSPQDQSTPCASAWKETLTCTAFTGIMSESTVPINTY